MVLAKQWWLKQEAPTSKRSESGVVHSKRENKLLVKQADVLGIDLNHSRNTDFDFLVMKKSKQDAISKIINLLKRAGYEEMEAVEPFLDVVEELDNLTNTNVVVPDAVLKMCKLKESC